MILITGCGRSGTKYITAALRTCGLDVRHERMGADGIVSSFFCFNAPRYPGRHPQRRPKFDIVLHQVRHPLKSIASIQTGRSWAWTCQFLPVGQKAPLLKRACYNWLIFNEEAERISQWTYRIEVLPEVWPELAARLHIDATFATVAAIPRNINTRPHSAISWEMVDAAAPEISDRIRAAAQRYGYVLQSA